ncbi:zf-CCHC domain-containing protein, partial [Tanacetum coccineum]
MLVIKRSSERKKVFRERKKARKIRTKRDDKKGKSHRKCFRCDDLNHLIGKFPKPPRNKDQKAFVGGSWSDSENEVEDKTNEETCLMAQSSNEVTFDSSHYSDNASSFGNDVKCHTLKIGLQRKGNIGVRRHGTRSARVLKYIIGLAAAENPTWCFPWWNFEFEDWPWLQDAMLFMMLLTVRKSKNENGKRMWSADELDEFVTDLAASDSREEMTLVSLFRIKTKDFPSRITFIIAIMKTSIASEPIRNQAREGKIHKLLMKLALQKSQNLELKNHFEGLSRHMEGLTNDIEKSHDM